MHKYLLLFFAIKLFRCCYATDDDKNDIFQEMEENYTKDTSAVDTIESEETRINRLRYISFYDEYNDVKNNDKLNDLIEKGNLREVTDENIWTYPRAILKKKMMLKIGGNVQKNSNEKVYVSIIESNKIRLLVTSMTDLKEKTKKFIPQPAVKTEVAENDLFTPKMDKIVKKSLNSFQKKSRNPFQKFLNCDDVVGSGRKPVRLKNGTICYQDLNPDDIKNLQEKNPNMLIMPVRFNCKETPEEYRTIQQVDTSAHCFPFLKHTLTGPSSPKKTVKLSGKSNQLTYSNQMLNNFTQLMLEEQNQKLN